MQPSNNLTLTITATIPGFLNRGILTIIGSPSSNIITLKIDAYTFEVSSSDLAAAFHILSSNKVFPPE